MDKIYNDLIGYIITFLDEKSILRELNEVLKHLIRILIKLAYVFSTLYVLMFALEGYLFDLQK